MNGWLEATEEGMLSPKQIADCSDPLSRRLRNQEIVLRIGERIAAIRDKRELLRLIVQEIQPIFDFHDCGLFIVSRDGQTHQDLAMVMPEISPSETNYQLSEQLPPKIPHPGSSVEWLINELSNAGRPLLLDFQELWEKHPDYPQYQVMKNFPFRDCLATNLCIGGEPFGMFCINAHQKNHFKSAQFPLFQQIANQVAIAIANILTNEELEQRAADLEASNAELRRQDALLLSITEATQCLLENDDLDTAIPQALKILGEGTQQDRVYIFENIIDEATGDVLFDISYEWNAPGISSSIAASDYFPVPMGAFPAPLVDPLKYGQVAQFFRKDLKDLDGAARELNEHGQANSLVAVPILIHGQWWGVIGFDNCHSEKHWSESEIAVLKIAASSIGSAIERDRTRKDREAAEKAVLNERNRMAREIHDTLAQSFTGIVMQLEAAKTTIPATMEDIHNRLRRTSDIARHGLAEARRSVHALRSGVLESSNLLTALQQLAQQMTDGTAVQAAVQVEGPSHPLPAQIEENLLRIGQEALTNALRHAQASQVDIRLLFEEEILHLSVSDNGQGFDPQTSLQQPGFGMVGMQERSHLINGDFHLNSQPGAGTTITVSVRTRQP
ncbi:MAG: GAF domain-containing protein [Elainellaceae cyanobacterium]